eukprot:g7518.t1
MVVFADSNSDAGRRYDAPASFEFEDIGRWPWRRVFDGPDSDEKTAAYMPMEGTPTNGKVWPTWLRIPDEHNFATASATATANFRSLETCTGYTGEGEEFPTGTLEEQIDRYMYEIVDKTDETLGYTHVIFIGTNELNRVVQAVTRYSIAAQVVGPTYQDPVPFDRVFEVDAVTGLPVLDDDGNPVPTFEPMIKEVIGAWNTGIARLLEAGVTGRILLANVGSPKGLPGIFGTPSAVGLDLVAQALRVGARGLAAVYPQVRVLDLYTLFAALVDAPSIFEELGFTPGENSLLADSCVDFNFVVDDTAEIMGTQALRHPDCQEECALCADGTSPCQDCLQGNPAITKCDDPSSKIFFDAIHFTTHFHLVFGEAIRQCSKDAPNYDRSLEDMATVQRPNKYKKWRQENPPKMVVFGDSNSDAGRQFVAPGQHQFEEYGIGPAPFKRLYAAPDSDEKVPAYMPMAGTFTNGKVWPTWLRIPDEHNFATASATASATFRNREPCTRYTGEFEEFPTGTLDEQITRYFHDIGDPPVDTLDYTHVIFLGNNDLFQAAEAILRYAAGGAGYQDPVAFDLVFQTDNVTGLPVLDDNGQPIPNFEPAVEAVINAWDDGIGRLVGAGVTGPIVLGNMGSVKGLSGIINTPSAAIFDALAVAASFGASQLALKYPQVKILDLFSLSSAIVDNPSIYEELGFVAPEGGILAEPCIRLDFTVDGTAEIMGTQALRHPDCQETCALCADGTSPCQNCLEGNPSITVCDDPYSRVFYDGVHYSTEFHLVFGEAIRLCLKDAPNYDRPFVSVLCPPSVI